MNAVLASQLGAPTRNHLLGLSFVADFSGLEFSSGALGDLRDGTRSEGEVVGRSPWGRSVHLRLVSARVEPDTGASHLVLAWDVSEQRRLEAELRHVAARSDAVLNATVDGIATIDRMGRLMSVNRGLLNLFGYDRSELEGQNVSILMPLPYRDEHDGYLQRYLETGVARIIGLGRLVQGQKKSGETFPLRLSVGEFTEGDQRRFVGVLSDLSEQVAAERESAELGVILEGSIDEIYVFDADSWRFRRANRGARENLGYNQDELRSLTPLEIKPEFDRDSFRALLEPLRRGAIPRLDFKTIHRRRDGSEYPVEVHLQYAASSNEYIAIILDITGREALERQLLQAQRMEAVGQLAGGIAHDFNNLLTSIQGSSELIASRLDEDHPARRALERIQNASERGAALTRQLLAFGRRQPSQPVLLDLNDAIGRIGDLMRRLLAEDIEYGVDLAPSIPPVSADPSQIDQILMNLVVNAGDAMPSGGRLSVSTRVADVGSSHATTLEMAPGRAIELAVRDTGTGISRTALPHIFEPFYTTKDVGKGTGLGLSTVYGIAKQCGWGLEVDSVEGEGSTFRLWIPAAAGRAAHESEPPPSSPASRTARGHVLLVEDDETVREHACEVLEGAGFQVTTADDAEGAAGVPLEAIDLLLSDVVMPGISGLELARRLRGQRPGLPVVLMSGYSDTLVADRETLPGEFPLIAKPFSNQALVEAVERALRP